MRVSATFLRHLHVSGLSTALPHMTCHRGVTSHVRKCGWRNCRASSAMLSTGMWTSIHIYIYILPHSRVVGTRASALRRGSNVGPMCNKDPPGNSSPRDALLVTSKTSLGLKFLGGSSCVSVRRSYTIYMYQGSALHCRT